MTINLHVEQLRQSTNDNVDRKKPKKKRKASSSRWILLACEFTCCIQAWWLCHFCMNILPWQNSRHRRRGCVREKFSLGNIRETLVFSCFAWIKSIQADAINKLPAPLHSPGPSVMLPSSLVILVIMDMIVILGHIKGLSPRTVLLSPF